MGVGAANGEIEMNTWPNGVKRAMHQDEHENWNAANYPGTRQMCSICDEPTGRCEDDTIYSKDGEPICEACADANPEIVEI